MAHRGRPVCDNVGSGGVFHAREVSGTSHRTHVDGVTVRSVDV